MRTHGTDTDPWDVITPRHERRGDLPRSTHAYAYHIAPRAYHRYMYVIFPSYVLDFTGSVRFLIVLILPPLLVVMAYQGDFTEDHFRWQQPHCGCSPAVSLTSRVLQPLNEQHSLPLIIEEIKKVDLPRITSFYGKQHKRNNY